MRWTRFRWTALDPEDRRAQLDSYLQCFGVPTPDFERFVLEIARGRPAFVGGSVVDGIWTTHSDADVFIVDDQADQNTLTVRNVGPVRVDFEVWPRRDIRRIVSEQSAVLDLTDHLPMHPRPVVKFVHRLLNRLPLGGEEQLERMLEPLSLPQQSLYMARRRFKKAEAAMQDAVGAVYSGCADYACSRARDVLDHAIDAYLCSLGDTAFEGKHRVLKMKRRVEHGHELLAAYRASIPRLSADTARMERETDTTLRWARSLLARTRRWIEAFPGVVHHPTEQAAPPIAGRPSVAASTVPLTRTSIPQFTLDARPYRSGGEVLVSSYRKAFPGEVGVRVGPIGTHICELLDGRRSIDDMAIALSARVQASPDRIAEDTVDFLNQLRELALVEHAPDWRAQELARIAAEGSAAPGTA